MRSAEVSKDNGPRFTRIALLVLVMIVLASLSMTFVLIRQNSAIKEQLREQQARFDRQASLLDSISSTSVGPVVNNLLDHIDAELRDNPGGVLSDATIARIAAYSASLKPYVYLTRDTFPDLKLSPERGHLMLMLSKMQLDTGSLEKIMFHTSFAGADLQGADLSHAYLKGADLKGANLANAVLRGAYLVNADLHTAHLWGADLQEADLTRADLRRARLGWANLNSAVLRDGQMDGASLPSAKLTKVDLSGTLVRWADLSGAFLTDANLAGTNFLDSRLESAHLTGSTMRGAHLARTDLRLADLTGTDLSDAIVLEKNWLADLSAKQVQGAEEILAAYRQVDHQTKWGLQYRLERKDE